MAQAHPLPASAPSLDAAVAVTMPSVKPVGETRKDKQNQRVSSVPLKCTRSQKIGSGYPQGYTHFVVNHHTFVAMYNITFHT